MALFRKLLYAFYKSWFYLSKKESLVLTCGNTIIVSECRFVWLNTEIFCQIVLIYVYMSSLVIVYASRF